VPVEQFLVAFVQQLARPVVPAVELERERTFSDTIGVEGLRDMPDDDASRGCSNPEIPVLIAIDAWLVDVAPDAVEQCAAIHRSRSGNPLRNQKVYGLMEFEDDSVVSLTEHLKIWKDRVILRPVLEP
jgi:hypothetical protein